MSHLEIKAFEVAVNHQHIVHIDVASVGTFLKMKFFRTADFSTLANTGFTFLKFDIEIENVIEVGFVFDDGRIKIGRLLKSQLFDDLVQCAFIPIQFAVFEFALQYLTPHRAVTALNFA